MIAIIWNCRGFGQPATRRSMRNYIVSHRPDLIFISEIKCNQPDIIQNFLISNGFCNCEFRKPQGHAGGLIMAWRNSIDFQPTVTTDSVISGLIMNDPLDTPWQFTAVYGPSTPCLRPSFWDSLKRIGEAFNGPWAIVGDFNAVLLMTDKSRGKPIATSSRGGFRQFLDDAALIDLGYEGPRFTWNNRRSGKANIQERLDRGFANDAWKLLFNHASITHLTAFNSNHRPILLQTDPPRCSLPKPFKFETFWTTLPQAGIIIATAWCWGFSLLSKLKNTKRALKEWNKSDLGQVQCKIKKLQETIQHIQKGEQSELNLAGEDKLQSELDTLLRCEELMWKDKAKTRWVEEGDDNTHFFHLSTIIH